MMKAVDIFHEPLNMKKMMRDVKPSIKNKHINEYLFDQLYQTELVLSARPVAIIGKILIYFP
jgi:hypothetical protein